MIEEYKEYNNEPPTYETKIPETSEELVEILKKMYKIEDENKITLTGEESIAISNYKVKNRFFERIRSAFKK